MGNVRIDAERPSRDLTLLVFLPDAVQSRLVGPVESWLRQRSACAPIARGWFTHTDESLRRFYPELVDAPFWSLISRAFSWGPCLATLWLGENAAQILPASKGLTHPASCSDGSVRGRFWCDNSLTNLIHVSDTPEDAAREIGVLRLAEPGLFEAPLATQGLRLFGEWEPPSPRHCAIWTLCSLLMTDLATHGVPFTPLNLPAGESARATLSGAEAWLEALRPSLARDVAAAVSAYLDATVAPDQLLAALERRVPVGAWETLVLTAGVLSRPEWRQAARERRAPPLLEPGPEPLR